MNAFLDASEIATFNIGKRAEATLVMLSYISDLKIVDTPECARAHKEKAIAAMNQLVDTTTSLGTGSRMTAGEQRIMEAALLEIGKVNDEATELDKLNKE